MFDALTQGFRAARQRLAGQAELSEVVLDEALRDVRRSLLEADVELGVAKDFLAKVKAESLGTVVQTRIRHKGQTHKVSAAEHFIHVCHRELEAMMADEAGQDLCFAPPSGCTGILMVGLQGSGKTTSSAKLARLLEREHGRKVLLVAADVARPGAIEQLQLLGERADIPVFAIPGGRPLDICTRATAEARKLRRDTIIYDTAGRLAIDDALMQELGDIQAAVKPQNALLVVDAMIGQDAVSTAAAFHDRLGLTGVVLTKLDGDARGGAALSVKAVTGAPIKFVGMGEDLERLETFRPEGMASRILGFGDVVGLMRDFEGVVDEQKAEADTERMLKGQFTLDDFVEQIDILQRLGPLQDVMEKLPFFSDSVPAGFQVDERELTRTKAMVCSMTPDERRRIDLFQRQPSRLRRVAKGAGRSEKEVTDLIQRFAFMKQMMGEIGTQAGMLGKIPGMKQLAMANRLRDAVQSSGLEDNPMLANLADSLLEAAVAGQGGQASAQAAGRRKVLSPAKKKSRQKMQKKSRRKSRR